MTFGELARGIAPGAVHHAAASDGGTLGDLVGPAHDVTILVHAEKLAGTPLLQMVMRGGQRLPAGRVELESARSHAQEELRRLPPALQALERADPGYE